MLAGGGIRRTILPMNDNNALDDALGRLMETVSPIGPLYLPEEGSDLIELGKEPIEVRTARETIQTLGRATVTWLEGFATT